MVQIVGQLQSVVHQSLVRWLSISCHLVFWFPLTRLKQNCVSFSIIAQTKYRDIIKFQRWSKPLTNVAPKLFKTQNEVISKTCQSPVIMLSNGIGISQHRLNSASCVGFICFGSKFRQNYRLWYLAHRKTRKKQGPSTCRAPAKKNTGHWLVHASMSCHMVFVCRIDSVMVQIVGHLQHIVHHGSLVHTCFNFVSRIDWHVVQVEVGQLQSVVDHWSLVLVFPRQTTWGGPFSRNVCFGFMTGKAPPPRKNMLAF